MAGLRLDPKYLISFFAHCITHSCKNMSRFKVKDLCVSQIHFSFSYKNNTRSVQKIWQKQKSKTHPQSYPAEIPLLKFGIFYSVSFSKYACICICTHRCVQLTFLLSTLFWIFLCVSKEKFSMIHGQAYSYIFSVFSDHVTIKLEEIIPRSGCRSNAILDKIY